MPQVPVPTVNDILLKQDDWQVRAMRQRIEYLHERLKRGERFMEIEIESMIDLLMQNYALHGQLDRAIRELRAGADLYWSMTFGKTPEVTPNPEHVHQWANGRCLKCGEDMPGDSGR